VRLLLFSDLHRDVDAARLLVAQAARADVLVGAGDFAQMRRGLADCLDVLLAVDRPLVLVAGNNETTDALRAACTDRPRVHVLHGDAVDVDGTTFFGLGGGIPVTPFGNWSYDFSDEEAEDLLAPCPPGAVLVSHSPPWGVLDRSSVGAKLGSRAVRAAIERTRPRLVVCGHIHASSGRSELLGEVPVVNAGPHGILWDLETGRGTIS
jgi:Icc-related predicted phosphoesterase